MRPQGWMFVSGLCAMAGTRAGKAGPEAWTAARWAEGTAGWGCAVRRCASVGGGFGGGGVRACGVAAAARAAAATAPRGLAPFRLRVRLGGGGRRLVEGQESPRVQAL